mgnify:CR=1 FL=1
MSKVPVVFSANSFLPRIVTDGKSVVVPIAPGKDAEAIGIQPSSGPEIDFIQDKAPGVADSTRIYPGFSSRSQIPFGNVISLEIPFPFSHRSGRCIPALYHGCEVELRGQLRSQVQLLSLPTSFGNE